MTEHRGWHSRNYLPHFGAAHLIQSITFRLVDSLPAAVMAQVRMVEQIEGHRLGDVVGAWKRFTAIQVNRMIGRSGPFWQTEYFDRFIRDETHWQAAVAYIENNPVKAGLVKIARDWPWSSARYRPV